MNINLTREVLVAVEAAHRDNFDWLQSKLQDLDAITSVIYNALISDNKLLIAGNGGSASDASHLAGELTGRFVHERRPLNAIALATNYAEITAIANDYGFSRVFERCLSAVGSKGDVFLAISTSGNSENLINAVNLAKKREICTIGLLGKDGGELGSLVDYPMIVPSTLTARVQEFHVIIFHLICQAIDQQILKEGLDF